MKLPDQTINERVSGLESSVTGLHDELSKVQAAVSSGFRDIQLAMSAAEKTNWSLILAGIVALLALYAAAIRPIVNDVERQDASAKTIAAAVLEQNKQLNESRVTLSIAASELARLRMELDALKTGGSPITDKRLAIVEYKLGIAPPVEVRR